MKEIFYNYDELKKDEIDEVVIRTKAIIIDSNNDMILGYGNKTYQFPGGHLEEGENLEECLIRELKEETGIKFNKNNFKPFMLNKHYTKNYKNSGKNRENDIYYFVIKTEEKYNLDNTSFDEGEIEGNYELRIINLDNIEDILLNSVVDNPINECIVEEMMEALKEYKKIYND